MIVLPVQFASVLLFLVGSFCACFTCLLNSLQQLRNTWKGIASIEKKESLMEKGSADSHLDKAKLIPVPLAALLWSSGRFLL